MSAAQMRVVFCDSCRVAEMSAGSVKAARVLLGDAGWDVAEDDDWDGIDLCEKCAPMRAMRKADAVVVMCGQLEITSVKLPQNHDPDTLREHLEAAQASASRDGDARQLRALEQVARFIDVELALVYPDGEG